MTSSHSPGTFVQAYITENYASTEVGAINNTGFAGKGKLSEGVVVKLVDWGPYKSTDKPHPRGEIWVKTRTMITRYLGADALTTANFDEDGYFKTGDVGVMPDQEHVHVIDRCKHVTKLANGEWVSPESIESVLLSGCPSIKRLFVHVDPRAHRVVAIIVPQGDGVTAEIAVAELSVAAAAAAAAAAATSAAGSAGSTRTRTLRHFEIPRSVHVTSPELDFNAQNGLLTGSHKLCRWKIRETFSDEIANLVQETEAQQDEQVYDASTRMLALLECCLAQRSKGNVRKKSTRSSAVAVREDNEEWAAFEWTSLTTMVAKATIDAEYDVVLPAGDFMAAASDMLAVASLVEHCRRVGSGSFHGSSSGVSIDWTEECLLDADIVQRSPGDGAGGATSKMLATRAKAKPKRAEVDGGTSAGGAADDGLIFVTGATGHYGAAIVNELVAQYPTRSIVCLVRVAVAGSSTVRNKAAQAKLTGVLESHGYVDADGARSVDANVARKLEDGTLVAIVGDLNGGRWLGMDQKAVCRDVLPTLALVVHCGARVNHILPYTSLKAENADSCSAIAWLASRAHKHVAVVYISTIDVAYPDSNGANGDESCVASGASLQDAGGYVQSKWVGEMRLREAAARRLCSLAIVRPGFIGGDSKSGRMNESDWLCRFLTGGAQIGKYCCRASDGSGGATDTLRLTPVDHAAALLMSIIQLFVHGQGTFPLVPPASTTARVFHVPITIVMPVVTFVNILSVKVARLMKAAHAEAGGACTEQQSKAASVKLVGLQEWRAALRELGATNPIYPLRDSELQDGLDDVPAHNHAATSAALLGSHQERGGAASSRFRTPRPYTDKELAALAGWVAIKAAA